MPSGVATALLVFGAVLTTVSPPAGVAFAALGLLVELCLFYIAGANG